jgi:hypothetical protein
MKKLRSLLIVYEDGTEKRLDADEIDTGVQSALADAGLCTPPPGISQAKHYLILEWKDGWQEVMSINSGVADLLRYYVIRRIEDRGRLVLDSGAEYPELHVIERLPMEISRLLIVGDSDVKSYSLGLELEGYEGTFEASGKKEFTRYDRENPHFWSEFSEAPENLDDIKNAVAAVLNDKNLLPGELLSMEQDRRIQEYKSIAKVAGIRGAQRQSDVYGFIELVLKKLVRQEGEGSL